MGLGIHRGAWNQSHADTKGWLWSASLCPPPVRVNTVYYIHHLQYPLLHKPKPMSESMESMSFSSSVHKTLSILLEKMQSQTRVGCDQAPLETGNLLRWPPGSLSWRRSHINSTKFMCISSPDALEAVTSQKSFYSRNISWQWLLLRPVHIHTLESKPFLSIDVNSSPVDKRGKYSTHNNLLHIFKCSFCLNLYYSLALTVLAIRDE